MNRYIEHIFVTDRAFMGAYFQIIIYSYISSGSWVESQISQNVAVTPVSFVWGGTAYVNGIHGLRKIQLMTNVDWCSLNIMVMISHQRVAITWISLDFWGKLKVCIDLSTSLSADSFTLDTCNFFVFTLVWDECLHLSPYFQYFKRV